MTNPLQPRPGFDWTRVRWTGPTALVDEICSYCGGDIDDDEIPLRLWNNQSWAAVFCEACMETWWGFERFPDEGDDAW